MMPPSHTLHYLFPKNYHTNLCNFCHNILFQLNCAVLEDEFIISTYIFHHDSDTPRSVFRFNFFKKLEVQKEELGSLKVASEKIFRSFQPNFSFQKSVIFIMNLFSRKLLASGICHSRLKANDLMELFAPTACLHFEYISKN